MLKTLIVDDEENVLKALQRVFMDADTEVLAASSGMAALEILKANEIALIISDQRMPGMNGSEFLKLAREIAPDAIRIILTGYADVNATVDAINKGGAYRYLEKPWKDTELLTVARDCLERYRILRENRRLTELTKKQNEELKRWSEELELYVQRQTMDLSDQNKKLAGLNRQLNSKIEEFIAAFCNLVDTKTGTARSHPENVAAITRKIGQKLGLEEKALGQIVLAARLHDIGKTGLPDFVIARKPEDLTPEERIQYKKHPVRGQSALSMIEEFQEIGTLIRHHHENFNGSGFPDGLRGRNIPLGSRIIACADMLDRSLGYGLDTQEISGQIKLKYANLLDPELAGLMEKSLDELAAFSVRGGAETALSLMEVRPGLKLSRDFRTGSGVLILTKGTVLSEEHMELLKRCDFLDPSDTNVFVSA